MRGHQKLGNFRYVYDLNKKTAKITHWYHTSVSQSLVQFPETVKIENQILDIVGFYDNLIVEVDENANKVDAMVPSCYKAIPSSPTFYLAINSIHVPEDHPTMCEKDGFILDIEQKTLIFAPQEETIIVPDFIESLSRNAFASDVIKEIVFSPDCKVTSLPNNSCVNLEKITCPDSLDSFGSLLYDSKKLTTIVFDKNPNFIFDNGILYSKDFKDAIFCPRNREGIVELHKHTENICSYAFGDCSKIKNIIFHKGLKSIERNAFQRSGIRKFAAPSTIEIIESYGFNQCDCLKIVDLLKTRLTTLQSNTFNSEKLSGIRFPRTLTTIEEKCFYECTNLKYVDFSKTRLIELKKNAFYKTGLETIVFPKTIRTIGDYCFNESNLSHIVFDKDTNLKEVGEKAFWNTNIELLFIPGDVETYSTWISEEQPNQTIVFLSKTPKKVTIEVNPRSAIVYSVPGTEIQFEPSDQIAHHQTLWIPEKPKNEQHDFSKFKEDKLLGRGPGGPVFLINDDEGNQFVCKKLLNFTERDKELFSKQTEENIDFKYQNILFSSFQLDTPCIYSKYVKLGTLQDIFFGTSELLSGNPDWFDNNQKIICLVDIISAMIKIHDSNQLHRNLKPSNIFVCGDHYKLGDIGVSREVHNEFSMKTEVSIVGNNRYKAPEVFTKSEYSTKSDVFSFGMIAYQILTGQEIKLEGFKEKDFESRIIRGYRPKLPSDLNQLAKDIITSCWAASPSDRITFKDMFELLSVKEFALFDDYDKSIVMGHIYPSAFYDGHINRMTEEFIKKNYLKDDQKGNHGACNVF